MGISFETFVHQNKSNRFPQIVQIESKFLLVNFFFNVLLLQQTNMLNKKSVFAGILLILILGVGIFFVQREIFKGVDPKIISNNPNKKVKVEKPKETPPTKPITPPPVTKPPPTPPPTLPPVTKPDDTKVDENRKLTSAEMTRNNLKSLFCSGSFCLDNNPKCPSPLINQVEVVPYTPWNDKCKGELFSRVENDEVIISNPENAKISYKISTDLGAAHLENGVKVHGACPAYGNKEIFYPTCGNQQVKVITKNTHGTETRIKFLNESIIVTKGSYTNWHTRNVANQTLLKERKEIYKSYKRKPPNIVVHVLDCVARAAFQRMMPKTQKYLDSLEASGKFKVFQFLRHNFANFQTIKNIPQIFGGFPIDPPYFTGCPGGQTCPESKCEWLYPFYRKLKYVVSQHSDQDTWCPQHQPIANRDKYYDHYYDLMLNLYGGYTSPFSKTENGVNFHLCSTEFGGHCRGTKFTYENLYESIKSFWKNYKDVPKFINVHQLEGHEPSYKILRLLEEKNGIQNLIQDIIKDENTIYFLVSDHGLVYGEPMKYQFGQYEKKNPLMDIIIPNNNLFSKEVLENLKHNQLKLTTHFDLHFTLKQLPFMFLRKENQNNVPFPKVHPNVPESKNLFTTKLTDRKCSEFGIADSLCLCVTINKIYLIKEIKDITINHLNSIVHPPKSEKNNCVKFTNENLKIKNIENYVTDKIEYFESILEVQTGLNSNLKKSEFKILLKKQNQKLVFSSIFRIDEFQKSKCVLPKHLDHHMWCICL